MLLTFEIDSLFNHRKEHAFCYIFRIVRITRVDPGNTVYPVYLSFIYFFYLPFSILIDHCIPLLSFNRSYYIHDSESVNYTLTATFF